jgi:hypothetical protein
MSFIFLAMVPENGAEVHVKWEGHKTIEDARKELTQIRDVMLKDQRVPMDCYVYEAEEPPFGLPVHRIDEVDFNFYREKTDEEKDRSMQQFNKAMEYLKSKAIEEERIANAKL